MAQTRSEIVAWVGSNIVPHEAHLRAWLRRMSLNEDEINDVVQDAYVSIARLSSVAHIRSGRNYLFQAAKTAMLAQIRKNKVVSIDRAIEIEKLQIADLSPSPEERVSAAQELERVRRLIDALPDRCREIFQLRRIEGMPQKEIAARMGLNEEIIEQQATRGLKLILKAIAGEDLADRAARPLNSLNGGHDAQSR